jgi:hypothetical protein
MSKRLRPSTQPSGKGLSIRPKAGQGRNSSISLIPPAPRLSQPGPAPAVLEQEAATRDSSTFETQRLPSVAPAAEEEEPESREEYTAPSAVLPTAALDWDDAKNKAVEVIAAPVPEAAPAFKVEAPPAKIEAAEPETRGEEPSSAAEPPPTRADSPAAKAEAAAPVEEEDEAEEPVPVAVKAEPVVAKVEPLVAKAEPVVVKAAAVEAVGVESTSPSVASPLAAAKASPPVAAAEVEHPALAATGKAERPVVENQNQGKSGKKNKGNKGQPAKVEPPKNAVAAKPAAKVEDEGDDEVRPSRKAPHADEIDLSSVSAEFFRRDHDSVPPVTEAHADLDEPATVQLSPAALARRARLRRLVAGVVSFAAVLSIAVVGKTLAAGKRPSSTVTNKPPVVLEVKPKVDETAAAVQTAAPKPDPAAVVPATPSAVPSADPTAAASAVPSAEPTAAASATPSAVPSADPAAPPAPAADAVALRKETENLLNRGKMKDAIVKAREAIAADPSDANAYLYLGSALQETGHWKDGIEAYSECVRNATKGPVNECRQMGGRK